jgi:hypothetical protein
VTRLLWEQVITGNVGAAGQARHMPGKAAHDGGFPFAEVDLPAAPRVLRVAPDPAPLRVVSYRAAMSAAERDVATARAIRTAVRWAIWIALAAVIGALAMGVGWAKQDAFCAAAPPARAAAAGCHR